MSETPRATDQSQPVETLPVPGPVTERERITSIDVLRGFVVLGILVMNIRSFSMVTAAYMNPHVYGTIEGADYYVWLVTDVVCSGKFMTIFSMLFGAGIVLMADRRNAAGLPSAGLHYRRTGVLLLIGLMHAHLLWFGDVLVTYAMVGFVVYLLRTLRPSMQISLGLVLYVIPCIVAMLLTWSMAYWPEEGILEVVNEWSPSAKLMAEETAIYRGGWVGQLPHRVTLSFLVETVGFVFGMFWMIAGNMLIGIALFKLGVFSAARSARFYVFWIMVAIGLGFPAILYGIQEMARAGWAAKYCLLLGGQYNHLAMIPVALGWVGVIMLICKSRHFTAIKSRLAAVGRMALTNYLMQTVICTLVFYGHGLGWFGHLTRVEQLGVVAAVWVVQLVVSPIWLRYCRFGPAEWAWRTMTYWRRQPLLRSA